MRPRISMKALEQLVYQVNDIQDKPQEPYTRDDKGNFTANIGNWHLEGAYGGWCINEIVTIGGGVSCPFGQGYNSKREIYNQLSNYIKGFSNAVYNGRGI